MSPLITLATSAHIMFRPWLLSQPTSHLYFCLHTTYIFYPRPASQSSDDALMLNATHHINLQPAKILVYISQDSMEIHFLVAAILTPSNNFQIFSFAGASQAEVRSDRKSGKHYFLLRRGVNVIFLWKFYFQ